MKCIRMSIHIAAGDLYIDTNRWGAAWMFWMKIFERRYDHRASTATLTMLLLKSDRAAQLTQRRCMVWGIVAARSCVEGSGGFAATWHGMRVAVMRGRAERVADAPAAAARRVHVAPRPRGTASTWRRVHVAPVDVAPRPRGARPRGAQRSELTGASRREGLRLSARAAASTAYA